MKNLSKIGILLIILGFIVGGAYIWYINRPNDEELSKDANLTNLTITGGTLSPAFNENVTSYIVTVDYQATGNATIIANPTKHEKATFDNSNTTSVMVSSTAQVKTMNIKVIAEDEVTSKMYTINVIMLGFVPVTPTIWMGEVALSFSGGNGTQGNPFKIAGGAELAYLAHLTNNGNDNYNNANVYYELTNNIILNDTSNFQNWVIKAPVNSWIPIGNSTNGFIANIDGAGFNIDGLYISNDDNNQGLFGVLGGTVKGGTIKNITIKNSYIKGKDYVGGVIGLIGANNNIQTFSTILIPTVINNPITPANESIEAWVRIENIANSATVIGSNNYVGGVAGALIATEIVQVINCINTGNVSGEGHVGGVIGYTRANNKVEIINSYNTANIIGSNAELTWAIQAHAELYGGTGGVVGTIISGVTFESGWIDVNNCYNTGTINGKDYTGGIVGYSALLGGYDPILNCYNIGNVSGNNYVGGIVGSANAPGNFGVPEDYILNNFNKGNVTAQNYVGGIAGFFGGSYNIVNCYNAGLIISSGTYKGGIAGDGYTNKSSQTSGIINCYYRIDGTIQIVGGIRATVTDSSSFNITTGSLTTMVNGNTTLLIALNDWVLNSPKILQTVYLANGGKYLFWFNTLTPQFIVEQALPSV